AARGFHPPAERGRHPGVAVHRSRGAPDRSGKASRRAGCRASYRRLLRGRGRAPLARARPHPRSGAACRDARPRMPCGPRARFRNRGPDRRHPVDRRAEYRPFPCRRGNFHRARPRDQTHACLDEGSKECSARGRGRSRSSGRMILGIGSDLIDIRRIERVLETYGDRFVSRIFTEEEQRRSERRANRAASYAKRYAAKEACAKALGTGFRAGVYWRDLGVVNLSSGRPTLVLSGGALKRLEAMTPAGMVADIHVSLTDEIPFASAFVLISAVPAASGR